MNNNILLAESSPEQQTPGTCTSA